MQTPRHKAAELIRLVRQLSSRSATERQIAEDILREMGPDASDGLLALVTAQNRGRFGRVYLRILAVFLPFMALWALSLPYLMSNMVFMAACGLVATMGFGLFGSYIARRGQMSRLQRKALIAIASYDDVRVIGPLAEALYYPDRQIQAMAATALLRLLPLLRDHEASLTRQQRLCLYYCLKPPALTLYPVREKPVFRHLILAVLRALVRTEDRTAISLVHSLAMGEGVARTDPEIREAAVACDQFLQQREQYGAQRDSLLRASAEQITAEQLLRPAQDSSETPAQLLLRSTASGESEER